MIRRCTVVFAVWVLGFGVGCAGESPSEQASAKAAAPVSEAMKTVPTGQKREANPCDQAKVPRARHERVYDPRECTGREPPKDDNGTPLTGERALAELLDDLKGGGPADKARWAEIKRCGSCHPREYRNWLAGPHAAAHQTVIRGTKQMAEESFSSKDEEWNIYPRQACCTCHCPTKNVFDHQIAADWEPGKPFAFKPLCVDPSEDTLTTGIDCLTCHAKGDKILAFPKKAPSSPIETAQGEGPPCDLVRSEAFAHINACVGCHWDVDAYQEEFDRTGGKEFPYLHCDECHMQKDEKGRFTHLYYFKGERREHVLKPAFERMKAGVVSHVGGRALRLDWVNDFLPHNMLHATPMIYQLVVEVLGDNDEPVFRTELRFYSRHFRNDLTPEKIRSANPTGELVNFRMGDHLERLYPLPATLSKKGKIRLTVKDKDGHDFPDSELVLVSVREISF